MDREIKKTKLALSQLRRAKSKRRGSREIERRLFSIFSDLARMLISSGYGVSSLNSVIRSAYVDAARSLKTGGTRGISNARIAALTGLTRTEVPRLLGALARGNLFRNGPTDRANRVTEGWASDEEFCDSSGPKVLPFRGAKKSFQSLVKRYSGDIPARAMYAEMERLQLVRRDPGGNIQLAKVEAPISRQTLSSLHAISQWVSSLAAINSEPAQNMYAATTEINLRFTSLPQALAGLRELENRRRAFVRTLEELSAEKRVNAHHELRVSIGVAATLPKLARVGNKSQGRRKRDE
jgi:hypothetical protein